jgi:2-keto-4-pentenoate hydratase
LSPEPSFARRGMPAHAVRAASDLLHEHWLNGTLLAQLPAPLRPRSRADGYAIQTLLEERTSAPLFGWKIAATSAAGQAHIGVVGPLAGRILRERVIAPGGAYILRANQMRVAELEFAFRMANTLAPRREPYALDEVLAAVGTLHPAIEIPDSRFEAYERVGAAQLIADNACAHAFLLGEAVVCDWRKLDLAAHRIWGRLNQEPPRAGLGENVLGDPRLALHWLVNELSMHGLTLKVGEVVTTGTCLQPFPIAGGDQIVGDFGTLGQVSIAIERS